MNENRLMQQVGTIFGIFMTFFYLGVGLLFILSPDLFTLSPNKDMQNLLRIVIGSTFVIYGIYRAYRTYVKVVELFFSRDEDKE